MFVRKRTGWLTNDPHIGAALQVLCDGQQGHDHEPCLGSVAKASEHYRPSLVRAVLEGLTDSMRSAGEINILDHGRHLGNVNELNLAEFHPQEYYDEYTGLQLDTELTDEAIATELAYMDDLGTYDLVDHDLVSSQGLKPIPCHWILSNKGDAARPVIRARLVAQETKRRSVIDHAFSSTPPLEALRLVLSMLMTMDEGEKALTRRAADPKDDKVAVIIDVSRAHMHPYLKRAVALDLPKEYPAWGEKFAMMKRSIYDLRDAGQDFELLVEEIMKSGGHTAGTHSASVYSSDKG